MSAISNLQSLARSYLFLRKGVGVIGIALPIVLLIGRAFLESFGILDSISAYYYSVMGSVFIGSLWAIAIFLISYRGSRWWENLAGWLAGGFAALTAVFPTTPPKGVVTQLQEIIGWVHLGFATCFFLILAFCVLRLFPEQEDQANGKQWRKMVYFPCGIALVICLVLIIIAQFLPGNPLKPLHPVFFLEWAADWAFGIAWFVSGEGPEMLLKPLLSRRILSRGGQPNTT